MKRMLGGLCLYCIASLAIADAPPRPPITGVSHIAVYAANSARSEKFYVHDLGATKGGDPETRPGRALLLRRDAIRRSAAAAPRSPFHESPGPCRLRDHRRRGSAGLSGIQACGGTSLLEHGSDGSQWFDVIDPEGNRIEFVEPPAARGLATAAHGSRTDLTPIGRSPIQSHHARRLHHS
jgi:catechol 2,3-dioxygenase-like lactoylglutathione lyase family enzyme